MLRAAGGGVRAGDYIWHGGVLCAVRQLGNTTVALTTYDRSDGTVENRETQHCFVADGEGEISYDAQLVMVDNVRESDDGEVYVAGGELLVVRAAESDTVSGGEVAEHRDMPGWLTHSNMVARCERPQLVLRRRRQPQTMMAVMTHMMTFLC